MGFDKAISKSEILTEINNYHDIKKLIKILGGLYLSFVIKINIGDTKPKVTQSQ